MIRPREDEAPDISRTEQGVMNESSAALSGFAVDIMAGQPFKGYEITRCLASGDHDAVFKAIDRNMDRNVALKVMRPWAGREGVVEDYFSLAGSIARLRCPGVARGLDAGRGGGNFFLAYEFVPGESLAVRLARRQTTRLTEKETLRLVKDLAAVLANLFELGHSHGNLHPGNIILMDGGKVTLADIGFAWTLAWPDNWRAFCHKPDYLPPERLRDDLNIDTRGDLYSLGAVWYAALLGRPVFKGETPEETLNLHLSTKPVQPRDVDPRVSAATSQCIMWLLEKERDARPRTPKELLRKLASHPLIVEEKCEGVHIEDDADSGNFGNGGTTQYPASLF